MTNHTQQGSINKHLRNTHNIKPKTQILLSNTEVITRRDNKNELQIAEALYIKAESPALNEQNTFSDRTLKVF